MVKTENKTLRLFTSTEEEIIEKMIKEDHAFRKLQKIIDFEKLITPYRKLYSDTGAEGIDVIKGFKSLLVQFWEDYSDREMEKVLEENVAVKWFCGFGLLEETPDHSYFGKLRKRLGTKNIADIFNSVITKNTMNFMDKIYDQQKCYQLLKANNCHSGIIKKNNNKTQNKDLDRWKSKTRMPFEGTFSKLKKRAKFRSQVKVLFQCFSEALCHNLKKAIAILPAESFSS